MVEANWVKMCRKTKICSFNAKSQCTRGSACNFAHSEEELRPLPDLSRTKFCPSLLVTGTCLDAKCKYAHTRKELKGGKSSQPSDCFGLPECGHSSDAASIAKEEHDGQPVFSPMLLYENAHLAHGEQIRFWAAQSFVVVAAASTSCGSSPASDSDSDRLSRYGIDEAERRQVSEDQFAAPEPHAHHKVRKKFLKTKMCSYFQMGRCAKGSVCGFAHTAEELCSTNVLGIKATGSMACDGSKLMDKSDANELSVTFYCNRPFLGMGGNCAPDSIIDFPEACSVSLCVKNTFLNYEPLEPLCPRMRRAYSEPDIGALNIATCNVAWNETLGGESFQAGAHT